MEKKTLFVPQSWKLWGMIFRACADAETAWVEEGGAALKPVNGEYYEEYYNALYSRWFLEMGVNALSDKAAAEVGQAWWGMKFHDNGTVDVPDMGAFTCDQDYIRLLFMEVVKINSLGASYLDDKGKKADAVKDFMLAASVLRWRVERPGSLDELSDADIACLHSLVMGHCVEERNIAYFGEEEPMRPGPMVFQSDAKQFMSWLYRVVTGKTLEGIMMLDGSRLTPMLSPDGKTYLMGASYLSLMMVVQSFMSTTPKFVSSYLVNSYGVELMFFNGDVPVKIDLEAVSLPRPSIPGTEAEMKMFEEMVGRESFLRIPEGIDAWEKKVRNVYWKIQYEPGEAIATSCWVDLVWGGGEDNIYQKNYEKTLDGIVKSKLPDVASRLVSFLSFLDAENRFLRENRERIVAHPLSCVAMHMLRGAFADMTVSDRELADVYAREDASAGDVARVMQDYLEAYEQYEIAEWIMNYGHGGVLKLNDLESHRAADILVKAFSNDAPSVDQVLDSIMLVNLMIASYIRDLMISKGISGERTEVKTYYSETEVTLDPDLYDQLGGLCDENGFFEGTKVAAAKALYENLIIQPKDRGANPWRTYLREVLPDFHEFRKKGRETPGLREHLSDIGNIRNILDIRKFDISKLQGGRAFRCKLSGEVKDLDFKAIYDAIIDLRKNKQEVDTRVEWILHLLEIYREKYWERYRELRRAANEQAADDSMQSTM